jgi:segregation and condensation protein B
MSLNADQLKNIIEAAILCAGQPVSVDRLQALFAPEVPSRDDIRAVLKALDEDCAQRGIELKEVASGFRFQARQQYADWLARLWEEKPTRYSRALLETLALVAYRQPITRGEIESIRGVAVSTHIMKTLQEREWVRVVGHRDVPGKPAMYATTREFLDYFNLKGLDQLPSLAEIKDLDSLHPELDLGAPDGEADTPVAAAIAPDDGIAADDEDDNGDHDLDELLADARAAADQVDDIINDIDAPETDDDAGDEADADAELAGHVSRSR